MKQNFTKSELILIEMMSGIAEGETAKNLNTKIRKRLGLSVSLQEDDSVENITRCIMREVMATKGRTEVVLNKEWLKCLARQVKKFLQGNSFTADESLVKLLGSGNAKEFYAKYPTAKYYDELYALINTWLVSPVPPTRINPLEYVWGVVLTILQAIDGKFGKKVLKPKYRIFWRIVTYSGMIYLGCKFVLFPFFEWWDKVVKLMNYIIWGC